MDDNEIIELFQKRDEEAVNAAAKKYSKYCFTISYNILRCAEDADECVNDTFFRAWNAIPPACPNNLAVYLGAIARRLSLNLYKKKGAEKRGFGQIGLAFSELEEVLPNSLPSIDGHSEYSDSAAITSAINVFLKDLPEKQRNIFVRRYWHLRSIEEIAGEYALTANNVKQILFRSRKKLKIILEKEGITI